MRRASCIINPCNWTLTAVSSKNRGQRQRQCQRQVRNGRQRPNSRQDNRPIVTKIKNLEESYVKLTKMYTTLQEDYGRMRANHTTMAVISRRLQEESRANEDKISSLVASKVISEAKIEKLEQQVASLTDENKELEEKKDDLQSYNFAKDARIKVIKDAVDNLRSTLLWGDHNLGDKDITELFKELDELL